MRALFWQAKEDGSTQCLLCAHRCRIAQGQCGRCGVRYNEGGVLRTLVARTVAAIHMDPVEKKPLYHFRPGSKTFSLGTPGCNFTCDFCQNHTISQIPRHAHACVTTSAPTQVCVSDSASTQACSATSVPAPVTVSIEGTPVSPRILVEQARRLGADSISFTYTEPTIFFELMDETSALAADAELACIMVSNGYMSTKALTALGNHITAANIDLKSFNDAFYRKYCGARLAPVLDTLRTIRALNWWLEITTLIIPGCNDSEEELRRMARFIRDELGADVPWHLSCFHGAFRMQNHPAPTAALMQNLWQAARDEGMRYVYLGNMLSDVGAATLCPHCSAPCITRQGFYSQSTLNNGACPACGTPIAGRWS